MTAIERLEAIRAQLDDIDAEVVALIARRLDLCREVADIKRSNAIPMMQPSRVAHVKEHYVRSGTLRGLDATFLERFVDLLVTETCRVETAIIEAGT